MKSDNHQILRGQFNYFVIHEFIKKEEELLLVQLLK
jgi:hypothetical protein